MADVFKALSDPTRRVILDELRGGAGDVVRAVVRLITTHGSSRPAEGHLATPRRPRGGGSVRTRREGRYKFHHSIRDRSAGRPTLSPRSRTRFMMRIVVTSVLIEDQARPPVLHRRPRIQTKQDIGPGRAAMADRGVIPGGSGRHRAPARAGRAPCRRPALRRGARRGVHPGHLVRGGRRRGTIRQALAARRRGTADEWVDATVFDAALWQPDPRSPVG